MLSLPYAEPKVSLFTHDFTLLEGGGKAGVKKEMAATFYFLLSLAFSNGRRMQSPFLS